MITDQLKNISRYRGLHAMIDIAIDWLESHDVTALENGRHSILGDDVFVNVMDARLRDREGAEYEYHDRYADLQLDLSGGELWQWSSAVPDFRSFDRARDCGSMSAEAHCTGRLGDGRFVLFFPGELHMPGCQSDTGAALRKAVIKIRM